MKKLLIVFLLLSFCSCQIEYDGETRLIVESHFIDSNGNPVPGKTVRIYVYTDSDTDLISDGRTDGNGNSLLIFPAPQESTTNIRVSVNANDGIYQSKTFDGLLKSDFNNYKLSLNNMVLYRLDEITSLNVILNPVSANTQLQSLSIEGQQPDEHIDFHPNVPGFNPFQTDFSILKNQNINLLYSVIDYSLSPAVVMNHSVSIAIGSEPVNYALTY